MPWTKAAFPPATNATARLRSQWGDPSRWAAAAGQTGPGMGARVWPMAGGGSSDSGSAGLAQVHLACGRIVGAARAIAEAHRFGVPEGDHERPWTVPYHAEAVHVYGKALPASYQREIASLFHHCVDTMARESIPTSLASDWVIVADYMRNASDAIMHWLAERPDRLVASGERPELEDHTPVVVHFDELAALTTHDGACRLERAALAVQGHVDVTSVVALDAAQLRLLKGIASGAHIVDLAEELGYSRSSIYREMSKLWEALGVPDRAHAISKAAAEGLLD